jgi:hypothetical protein
MGDTEVAADPDKDATDKHPEVTAKPEQVGR